MITNSLKNTTPKNIYTLDNRSKMYDVNNLTNVIFSLNFKSMYFHEWKYLCLMVKLKRTNNKNGSFIVGQKIYLFLHTFSTYLFKIPTKKT